MRNIYILGLTSNIHANLGLEPNGRVQRAFTDACYRHMDKYVPKRDGVLRTVVSKKVDSITYESNYAHAQYIGKVHGTSVKNYTTPGTGPYWDKRMVSAEMTEILKEMRKVINGK